MNNQQLLALLEKYLDGKCLPEEISMVNAWYERYEGTGNFTDSLHQEEKIRLKVRMLKNIHSAASSQENNLTVHQTKPLYQSWFFRIAVAASLILLIKFLYFNRVAGVGAVQLVRVSNTSSNIYRQILPDHSTVYLNPGATLTFPKTFAAKFRKVSMSGDCFFEVTKNPNRPFIIASSRIITKVWGTSFRVVDQKSIADASVTVLTGKVSVSKNNTNKEQLDPALNKGELMLYPKEKAVIRNNQEAPVKDKTPDLSSLKIWQHVDLSFNGTKLSEIVLILNRRFDVNIVVRDEKAKQAVMTADLNDLNLPEVLDVLKASLNLDYQMEQQHIVLSTK